MPECTSLVLSGKCVQIAAHKSNIAESPDLWSSAAAVDCEATDKHAQLVFQAAVAALYADLQHESSDGALLRLPHVSHDLCTVIAHHSSTVVPLNAMAVYCSICCHAACWEQKDCGPLCLQSELVTVKRERKLDAIFDSLQDILKVTPILACSTAHCLVF